MNIYAELYRITQECLEKITQVVNNYRRQAIWYASEDLTVVTKHLQSIFCYLEKISLDYDGNVLLEELSWILQAQKEDDVLLMADMLEHQLVPLLTALQEQLRNSGRLEELSYWGKNMKVLKEKDSHLWEQLSKDTDTATVYHLEEAMNGAKTIRIEEKGRCFYFHSCIDPRKEATMLADGYYDKDVTEYIFYGFGLGYYAEEMMKKSRISKIIIVEPDRDLLKIAVTYMDLATILNEDRIKIIIGNERDYISLLKKKENAVGIILYQMLKRIDNPEILEYMKDYYMKSSAVKWQKQLLEENFIRNVAAKLPEIGELRELFRNRNMILVAAGPSLERDLKQLKEMAGTKEYVVVAVGTVARKLVEHGIKIDCIVATTGVEEMEQQIQGIENIGVPLCLLATAAHTIAQKYRGEKYLVYQKGFKPAEEIAEKRGYSLYETGGSVATLVLDIGIQMGCREICFLGLDLAYTNGETHIKGTGNIMGYMADVESLKKVVSTEGGFVYTPQNLDACRKWIEKKIQKCPEVKYINASGGARIYGTIEKSLTDYYMDGKKI